MNASGLFILCDTTSPRSELDSITTAMFFITLLEASLIYVHCMIVEPILPNQSHHINQSFSLQAASTTSHTTEPKLLSSFSLENLEKRSTDSHISLQSLNHLEATTLDSVTHSHELISSWRRSCGETEKKKQHSARDSIGKSSNLRHESKTSMRMTAPIVRENKFSRIFVDMSRSVGGLSKTGNRTYVDQSSNEILGDLLGNIVLQELRNCVLLVAADESFWKSVVMDRLLKLPNSKQV